MTSRVSHFHLVLGLAAGVLGLGPLGAAPAQTLTDGLRPLEAQLLSHRILLRDLFKGDKRADPNDKVHVDAIDAAAKNATYRVYLERLEIPNKDKPTHTIGHAFKDFEGDVEAITKAKDREQMQPLGELFRDKVRVHALEVIQFDKAKPIHKIHNARILAKVAELGQGKLGETLIAVLKDGKQNDAVHYYALRGLGTLLAQVSPQQMPPLMTKDEQAKCAEAILDFLNRKPALSKSSSKEEVEGFRLLRREAVRALAQVRMPAVSDKALPALVLARFAGNDERIQPPLRIDERLEAAIGLARMRSAQSKEYQPDYAANIIGVSISAFGSAAIAENEKKADERHRPWKIDAARLSEALAALKTDNPKNAYVVQIADRGTRVLQSIVKGAGKDLAAELTWFTNPENAPPSKELFKGVADSVVKPAAKPEEAPEK